MQNVKQWDGSNMRKWKDRLNIVHQMERLSYWTTICERNNLNHFPVEDMQTRGGYIAYSEVTTVVTCLICLAG